MIHAIHPSSGNVPQLSDECIKSGVEMMTRDFRATDSDRSIDTGIQFQLATHDPSGNPTNGIVRYSNDDWFYAEKTPDGSSFWTARWDQSRYLNIFIKSTQDTRNGGSLTLLGYAFFPYDTPSPIDGIVMLWRFWGALSGYGALYGGCGYAGEDGETAAHEVGHYLA